MIIWDSEPALNYRFRYTGKQVNQGQEEIERTKEPTRKKIKIRFRKTSLKMQKNINNIIKKIKTQTYAENPLKYRII